MIQNLLIRTVLNPVAKWVNKIPLKVRECIFMLAAVTLLARYLFNDLFFVGSPYFLRYAFSCLLVGVMLLMSLPDHVKAVRLRTLPTVCWLGAGVLMLITSLLYNVDWLSDALIFLAVCPVTFLVWGNTEHPRLLRLLSRSCVISFILFMVASMVLIPIEDRQYAGLFCNVNGTAIYLILVFACLLTEILRSHRQKWILGVHYLLLGISGTLIFYTNSRTGQLAAILAWLCIFGLSFVRDWKFAKKALLIKMLCSVLILAAMMPTTIHLFRAGNQVANAVFFSSGSETPTDAKGSFSTFLEHNNAKTQMKGKDASSMSTGRVDIWKQYLGESHLFGSDVPENFWIESRQAYYSTAHMTWVTYAFRHGYICSALFLAYNIMMGMVSVVYAWKRKGDYLSFLPLTVSVVFAIAALLASVNTPFCYMVTIYYYFVQAPLLVKGFKEDNNDDETVA